MKTEDLIAALLPLPPDSVVHVSVYSPAGRVTGKRERPVTKVLKVGHEKRVVLEVDL